MHYQLSFTEFNGLTPRPLVGLSESPVFHRPPKDTWSMLGRFKDDLSEGSRHRYKNSAEAEQCALRDLQSVV